MNDAKRKEAMAAAVLPELRKLRKLRREIEAGGLLPLRVEDVLARAREVTRGVMARAGVVRQQWLRTRGRACRGCMFRETCEIAAMCREDRHGQS